MCAAESAGRSPVRPHFRLDSAALVDACGEVGAVDHAHRFRRNTNDALDLLARLLDTAIQLDAVTCRGASQRVLSGEQALNGARQVNKCSGQPVHGSAAPGPCAAALRFEDADHAGVMLDAAREAAEHSRGLAAS